MLGSFERLVPHFAIAVLILCRESILIATTPQQIVRSLESSSRTITSRRLSSLSERLFMGSLRNDLGIRVTNIDDVSNDLFEEQVRLEEKKWNEGVPGLDEGLSWTTIGNQSFKNGFQNMKSGSVLKPARGSETNMTGLEAADYLETKKGAPNIHYQLI